MEQSADRLLREMEGASAGVSGVVRVATTAALGSDFLTPRLPSLYAQNPDMESGSRWTTASPASPGAAPLSPCG